MNELKKLSREVQKDESVFIAPNSTVIGNVSLEKNSSVWFGAVLRGDSDVIKVGENTNIQDNAVVHCDPNFPAHIGNNCTIGHCAIVHGCTLQDNVLVGMNATILNGAVIGKNTIIGANSLVTAGTIIPDNSMVIGVPAKVVKKLSEKHIQGIQLNADVYVNKAKEYLELLK
jgi:carbonic anhydrase/acetyltransferase-like protein (isoleucine patch superfamily)